jgi:hypothetical protein
MSCLCEVDGEDPTCKFGYDGLSDGFVRGCDDADESVELPIRSVWGEVFGIGLRGHIDIEGVMGFGGEYDYAVCRWPTWMRKLTMKPRQDLGRAQG